MRRNSAFAAAALVGIALITGAGYLYLQYTAEQRVNQAIAGARDHIQFTYGDLRTDLFKRVITLSDIEVESINGKPVRGVSVAKVVVGTSAAMRLDPGDVDLEIVGLKFDLTGQGASLAPLVDMGYGTIEVDTHVEYQYSESSDEFRLKQLTLDAHDILTLEASVILGNISGLTGAGLPDVGAETTIGGGSFTIKDAVIIDRLIGWYAEEKKVAEGDIRRVLTSAIGLTASASNSEEERRFFQTLSGLIEKPAAGFTVTVSPDSPVSFGTLRSTKDPAQFAELLGLQLVATRP